MKHVVNGRMVAHLWAQQNPEQEYANSGNGNISYRDNRLYSWSTEIARIVTAHDGTTKVALFSDRSYSVSTSRHQSYARNAVSCERFDVPYGFVTDHLGIDHEGIVKWMLEDYEETKQRAGRTRSLPYWFDNGEINEDARRSTHLHDKASGIVRYLELFAVQGGAVPDVETDIEEINQIHLERRARLDTPARRRQRAMDEAARRVNKERIDREQKERHDRNLAMFRVGSYVNMSLRDEKGGAYIRADGPMLYTSLGAAVPLARAITMFHIALDCIRTGTPFRTRLKIGDFQLTEIDNHGTIIAGCHTIYWEESERLALEIGVLKRGVAESMAFDPGWPVMEGIELRVKNKLAIIAGGVE